MWSKFANSPFFNDIGKLYHLLIDHLKEPILMLPSPLQNTEPYATAYNKRIPFWKEKEIGMLVMQERIDKYPHDLYKFYKHHNKCKHLYKSIENLVKEKDENQIRQKFLSLFQQGQHFSKYINKRREDYTGNGLFFIFHAVMVEEYSIKIDKLSSSDERLLQLIFGGLSAHLYSDRPEELVETFLTEFNFDITKDDLPDMDNMIYLHFLKN